jgi:hypothetical protein
MKPRCRTKVPSEGKAGRLLVHLHHPIRFFDGVSMQEDVVGRIHDRLAGKSQCETTDADGQVRIALGGTSLGKSNQLFGPLSYDIVAVLGRRILVGNLQQHVPI